MGHKNKDKLVIEYLNARSLLSNFEEIKLLVKERDIDILCVSETWLEGNINDSVIDIPDFKVFRSDGGRGGGSCIYVREHFQISKIDLNINKDCDVEIEDVWLSIQYKKFKSFILGCLYRHPHAKAESFRYLVESFRSVCLKNKPVYVFGDLNDNLLDSNSRLLKIIKSSKLSQMIHQPTRVTANTATLLDPVITNSPENVIYTEVLPGPVADHELISTRINCKKPKKQPQRKTFRNLKDYSPNNLCSTLLNEVYNLNSIFSTDDVNKQVELFSQIFYNCIDSCAPIVTKDLTRPSAPWINNDIKNSINKRNELQRELKKDRLNLTLQQKYKDEKKIVKSKIQSSKQEYYRQKFTDNKIDISSKWKLIKTMTPNMKNKADVPNFENVKERVAEFNSYFANVGKVAYEKSQANLDNQEEYINNLKSNYNERTSFKIQPVDKNTIILIVKELNDTHAVGSDGIPLKFIKDSLPVILSYLLAIVNTSIVTHTFPNHWKHPYVVPVFKSGDSTNVSNYRPISILPILSKIIEKIVAKQIMSYLESNNLLSKSQHGFRSKLSTETALLQVTNKLYQNIDQGKISLLVLLDLSKAFDSISHEILIAKCMKLNIDPRWLLSYLSNRKQSVRLGSEVSEPHPIQFGVPQGSILGPIIFIICVNDFHEYVENCLIEQYADDTQLVFTGDINNIEDLIRKAEAALNQSKLYFQRNGLLVNEKKTQCIFIGSRQYVSRIPSNTNIKFGDIEICPSSSVKSLGVHIDKYLSFESHIDEMSKKVTGTLYCINRIKNNFDPHTRILVIQSLVLSVLNYCLNVWGVTSKTQLDRVQRLQNFAAKVADGKARKYDHVSPILSRLKWLKVDKKVIFNICVLVYKFLNNIVPNWIFNISTVNQAIHNRETRQINNLAVPRTSTDTGKRDFHVTGPKHWNDLPRYIRESGTLSSFKFKLNNFLLNQ